jgi:transketolase
MRDAFIQKLSELAKSDDRVALLTGDLGFGVLDDFARSFPNQYINAGIAEQNMTALAAGMALTGWKTYTYSIANFTTLRCLEQIRNDVCYHGADVKIISVGGGFSYGQLGMSHFATEDMAIMRALPEMRVVAPAELWEVQDLAEQLYKEPGPAYLRIDKSSGGTPRKLGERAEIGKARIVRDGQDLTILSIGGILKEAVAAAATLADAGVEARVVSVSSLKPFDTQAVIAAATETGGLITVEEHNIIGGLAGAVAEACMEAHVLPGFFRRLGLHDCYPSVVGDQSYLRTEYGLDAQAIVAAVLEAIAGSKQ